MAGMEGIWRAVTERSTYQRWIYLILGGALSFPYVLVTFIVLPAVAATASAYAAKEKSVDHGERPWSGRSTSRHRACAPCGPLTALAIWVQLRP